MKPRFSPCGAPIIPDRVIELAEWAEQFSARSSDQATEARRLEEEEGLDFAAWWATHEVFQGMKGARPLRQGTVAQVKEALSEENLPFLSDQEIEGLRRLLRSSEE